MSAEQAEVNLFQVKKKFGQRLESLKDPFGHSSPLLDSKPRRFAGNFESSFPLPKQLSFSESQLDAIEKTKVKVAPSDGSLVTKRYGTPQVSDLLIPRRRYSADAATPATTTASASASARRDSIDSESSDTKNYYFGKSASVAYVNFADVGVGTLKKELSEIQEIDEIDNDEVEENISVGTETPSKGNIISPVAKEIDTGTVLEFPKLPVTSYVDKRVSALKFAQTSKLVSALTQLVVETNDSGNPFARDFSFFDGKSDANPLKLTMFLPFSLMGHIDITVKKDANVQEVIGYTLYEYVNKGGKPVIPSHLYDTSLWSIRIAEEDGTIDDDFPALDRSRQIHKFGYDNFALCSTVSFDDSASKTESVAPTENVHHAMSNVEPEREANSAIDSSQAIFLKIHLYSTTNIRQTTTIHVPIHLKFKDIFDQVCLKYKYDPKQYSLKLVDGMINVPMDKTLEDSKVTECCIIKKEKAPEIANTILSTSNANLKVNLPDFRGVSNILKEYSVLMKGIMGKYERILSIHNDYFYLVANSKHIFDRETTKTVSHPISCIVSIKQSKSQRSVIKLSVKLDKSNAIKSYELEASSIEESDEIYQRLKSGYF